MHRILHFLSLLIFVLSPTGCDDSKDWELTWSEEFDYIGKPNEEFWGYETGYVRNRELQYYTDLLATCAAILDKPLPINAGEDSYNILPALQGEPYEKPIREATIHHSSGGSFAIRQGKWKLEFCAGSGGWSKPGNNMAKDMGLPEIQLYDLSMDLKEENNLYDQYPGIVEQLSSLLQQYMDEGRSAPIPATTVTEVDPS